MSRYLRPVYGWAMKFTDQDSSPYENQSNIQGLYTRFPCPPNYQNDGRFSQSPPFYRLETAPYPNPIYYNYTLPNTYPYVPGNNPKPSQYWYYPYYQDNTFWNNAIEIPKN